MNFEKFFRFVSYASVFCGFFALWVSGTFGALGTVLFIALVIGAWVLEGSRWQLSERIGTLLSVLSLPVFYFIWKLHLVTLYGGETIVAAILARMILSLTVIKLLQKKGDRDWIVLYMMSFFEVLLAAGLSISALYFASFLAYLLVTVCAIIAFEIRKTSRTVSQKIDGKKAIGFDGGTLANEVIPARRLPSAAIGLIVFIIALAIPLFFVLPRVGGAGFGGRQGGLQTTSGFSDKVKLGGIGSIQQSNEVVMRVMLEPGSDITSGLYFRGIVLDKFEENSWSKSKPSAKEPFIKGDRELIQVDLPAGRDNLSIQTIYLEPLDTPVLFALPRAVAVQGNFPVIYKDAYGALRFERSAERISYKVLSDRGLPSAESLRADNTAVGSEMQNYLQLPENHDRRIFNLAYQITSDARNRYDKARAIEGYLQNNFGYTLEQKAGGDDPLSDFLFNVREGHCEYFATAMAVMLRSQGIATRIVNGFHGGEYNDTADVTVVRQRNAHSWVEVYFPGEKVWVPFDPTPFSPAAEASSSAGLIGSVNKYIEALETLWIQYFVAFDNQEQRSLVRSVRNGFVDYQSRLASYTSITQNVIGEWWAELRGDRGLAGSLTAAGYALASLAATVVGILLVVWAYRRTRRLTIWTRLWDRFFKKRHASIVEFYERMQTVLASKGILREPHQTPLEFAWSLGMPEAVGITKKYNAVRFGEKELSQEEAAEVETWLKKLEAPDGGR